MGLLKRVTLALLSSKHANYRVTPQVIGITLIFVRMALLVILDKQLT